MMFNGDADRPFSKAIINLPRRHSARSLTAALPHW